MRLSSTVVATALFGLYVMMVISYLGLCSATDDTAEAFAEVTGVRSDANFESYSSDSGGSGLHYYNSKLCVAGSGRHSSEDKVAFFHICMAMPNNTSTHYYWLYIGLHCKFSDMNIHNWLNF